MSGFKHINPPNVENQSHAPDGKNHGYLPGEADLYHSPKMEDQVHSYALVVPPLQGIHLQYSIGNQLAKFPTTQIMSRIKLMQFDDMSDPY